MKFGWKRIHNLIDKASNLRKMWCSSGEQLDIASIIQFEIPMQVYGFKWDIIADDEWDGSEDEEAFVSFSKIGRKAHPTLSIRERVWEAALRGDNGARFTLAHEVAHVFLHQKLANVRLSREPHKCLKSRTNATQEHEANIFAGALLIDFGLIHDDDNIFTLRSRYKISKDVAIRALEQFRFIKKSRGF